MGDTVQVKHLLHGGTTTVISGSDGCNYCGGSGLVYPKCPCCGKDGNPLGRVLESAWQLREALTTSQREREQLRVELEKANNEFGSQTADWPDLWRRIAELKEEAGKRWQRAEQLQARVEAAEKAVSEIEERAKVFHELGEAALATAYNVCAGRLRAVLASTPAAPVQAEGEK